MAISPFTQFAAVTRVMEYLRPDRSPFFVVIVTGIAGIMYLCSQDILGITFYVAALPIVAVLTCLTGLCLISTQNGNVGGDKGEAAASLSPEELQEIDNQLRLSRSLGIMSGVFCLALGGSDAVYELPFILGGETFSMDVTLGVFCVIYVTSVVQILIFVVYAAIRVNRREPAPSSSNFVQIALVTSAFLVGAAICMYQADELTFIVRHEIKELTISEDGTKVNKSPEDGINKFLLASIALYLHWLWCQVHWVKQLGKVVQISIRPS